MQFSFLFSKDLFLFHDFPFQHRSFVFELFKIQNRHLRLFLKKKKKTMRPNGPLTLVKH